MLHACSYTGCICGSICQEYFSGWDFIKKQSPTKWQGVEPALWSWCICWFYSAFLETVSMEIIRCVFPWLLQMKACQLHFYSFLNVWWLLACWLCTGDLIKQTGLASRNRPKCRVHMAIGLLAGILLLLYFARHIEKGKW